ncbi:conjugal transfer protein TrbA [uncultured Eubacterium sp.]|nr:conjugal transfer protein TrbA [uncultured Eubacterium sp.]
MGFGTILKQLLDQHDMTIRQLSEKTGISANTLYAITKRDSSNVRSDILQKIAFALDVPIEVLISMINSEARETANELTRLEQDYYEKQKELSVLKEGYQESQKLLAIAEEVKCRQQKGRGMLAEALYLLIGQKFCESEVDTIIQTAKILKSKNQIANYVDDNFAND